MGSWGSFKRRSIACSVAIALLAFLLEFSRPDLLIVGPVTVDTFGAGSDGADASALGGAVSYAAVAARALGARACVVTTGQAKLDGAPPAVARALSEAFAGHTLVVVPANATLTFAHSYTFWGSHRKLAVIAKPNVTLTRAHVPLLCRRARAVVLGPLTLDDIDAASFLKPAGWWDALLQPPGGSPVSLLAQGFQRRLGAAGEVSALDAPSPQLWAGLSRRVALFLSDVETDAWRPADLAAVAARARVALVTRGERGADEYYGGGGGGGGSGGSGTAGGDGGSPGPPAPRHIPAVKIDAVADTNGAGDTFATAFTVAALVGDADPGAAAAWAASRAVMQPQNCKPACAAHLLQSGDAGRARRVTRADRARLAAVALLERAGVAGAARAMAGLRGPRAAANLLASALSGDALR